MWLNSCTQEDTSMWAYGNYLWKMAMMSYPPRSEGGGAKHCDRRFLKRFMVSLNVGDVRVPDAKPTTLRRAVNVVTEHLAILDPSVQGSSMVE
jgi:hypothetical protein